jgi:hypothetical protein
VMSLSLAMRSCTSCWTAALEATSCVLMSRKNVRCMD